MTCVRDDGTVTGMASSDFFVLHDLGHLAIETELGFGQAFFGLIAAGWDIPSFEERAPDSRKCRRLPVQATQAEILAGLLDMSRANPSLATTDLLEVLASLDPPKGLVEWDQLEAIQRRHRQLMDQWRTLAPGGQLELSFTLRSEGAVQSPKHKSGRGSTKGQAA